MSYCIECGQKVPDIAKYCCRCGTGMIDPSSLTPEVGDRAVFSVVAGEGSIAEILPTDGEWIDSYGVKYSADKTKLIEFNDSIEEYVIPDGTEVICIEAFSWCYKLRKIVIPNSVKMIGDGAFGSCDGLEDVVIGNSVEAIGKSAFRGCEVVKSIELPISVRLIGSTVFNDCDALESIKLHSGSVIYNEMLLQYGDKVVVIE